MSAACAMVQGDSFRTISRMRRYDVIVHGATGFTGRLIALYLSRQGQALRWAISGRRSDALTRLQTECEHAGGQIPDVLLADNQLPETLLALAQQTRVLLSAVGPYALHGEPVVAACIAGGADYVDLAGEPGFVSDLLARHGASAQRAGRRIVPCCGFDSVPHDMGVYFTLRLLQDRLGSERMAKAKVSVVGRVQARGQISGGTWQSALHAFSGAAAAASEAVEAAPGKRKSRRKIELVSQRPQRVEGGWALPLPTIDPQVIARSAQSYGFYGREFSYSHQLLVRSAPKALMAAAGLGGVWLGSRLESTRQLLSQWKRSGEGPNARERQHHWFRVEMNASARLGMREQHHVRTVLCGGDPGYDETARMIGESALCLAFDGERLPAASGVLTPAQAMGDALLDRLRGSGLAYREEAP